MRETRIVRKWSSILGGTYYITQYKKWFCWWDIYNETLLPLRESVFLTEKDAELAIDKFIANGYKQHDKVEDTGTTIIKYLQEK